MDVGRCFVKAVLAGMMISMGGVVFLMYPEYKFVGALLFSVGLFAVLTYGFNLYTGKVCYIFENGKEYFLSLIIIILGNFTGCLIMGVLFPIESAVTLCNGKLCLDAVPALVKGFGCGVMMFLAVDVYKTKNSYLGVFLCVPTFILAGFEHSVADMFYLCSAGVYSLEALTFIILVIVGNAVGGFLIPLCKKYLDGEDEGGTPVRILKNITYRPRSSRRQSVTFIGSWGSVKKIKGFVPEHDNVFTAEPHSSRWPNRRNPSRPSRDRASGWCP